MTDNKHDKPKLEMFTGQNLDVYLESLNDILTKCETIYS